MRNLSRFATALLLAAVGFSHSFSASAQAALGPVARPAEQFCMIQAAGKLFSTKVSILIDYGQAQKPFTIPQMRDDAGKVQTFNSIIDALNYMSGQGWEYLSTTVESPTTTYYLMRRRI